jgi:hypothetical protein
MRKRERRRLTLEANAIHSAVIERLGRQCLAGEELRVARTQGSGKAALLVGKRDAFGFDEHGLVIASKAGDGVRLGQVGDDGVIAWQNGAPTFYGACMN